MPNFITKPLRAHLIEGVHAAGREVLAIYPRGFIASGQCDERWERASATSLKR